MSINSKVVLITGSAGGLGAALARRLVASGASVVVTDLQEEPLKQLTEELGDKASYCVLDVTQEAQWQQAITHAVKVFGRLDGLVNNAGIYWPSPLEETSTEAFDKVYRVNQLGTFLGMKYAALAMKETGGRSIVNLSSIFGMKGFEKTIAYGAAKWAVRGMSKIAARDLGKYGIRVNSIHPGAFDTQMVRENPSELLQQWAKQTPLGRLGRPDECADAMIYLLSDASSFITGSEILIDGGLTV